MVTPASGRTRFAAVGAIATSIAFGWIAACGDGEGNDVRGGPSRDAASPLPEAEAVDAPPALPLGDAGAFEILDVADTPCVARGGTAAQILAQGTTFAPLSMVNLGTRRAALGLDGVILMNADGSGASAPLAMPFGAGAIASTPNTLFAFGIADRTLRAARFDQAGASLGALPVTDVRGLGAGAGGGEGKIVVSWLDDTAIMARGIDEQGTSLSAFLVRRSVAEILEPTISVAYAGANTYGIAYSGKSFDGDYRLAFTRVSASERTGVSYTLTFGKVPLRLAQVTATPAGYVVLFTYGEGAAARSMLLPLDALGRISGKARRLQGTLTSFGIASSGSEVGVVTWRRLSDTDPGGPGADAVELRPFDVAGEPLGPWVCLDQPSGDPDTQAALVGEANGYAITIRMKAKTVALLRVDRRGTGNP